MKCEDTMDKIRLVTALMAALILAGCMTPAENAAVNFVVPVLVDGLSGEGESESLPTGDKSP